MSGKYGSKSKETMENVIKGKAAKDGVTKDKEVEDNVLMKRRGQG